MQVRIKRKDQGDSVKLPRYLQSREVRSVEARWAAGETSAYHYFQIYLGQRLHLVLVQRKNLTSLSSPPIKSKLRLLAEMASGGVYGGVEGLLVVWQGISKLYSYLLSLISWNPRLSGSTTSRPQQVGGCEASALIG